METSISNNRIYYFDLINVFACFSVVALHCNGYVHWFTHDLNWYFALIIEVLFYSAVPLFFMLSGATLFDYSDRYTTKEFYIKRFKKTFIPYFFFTTVFFFIYPVARFIVKHKTTEINFMDYIRALCTGNVEYGHFWFFIPLFLLYIFMPFLSKIIKNSTNKEIITLIAIIYSIKAIVPILNKYLSLGLPTNLPIDGYFVYAALGYLLAKNDYENSKSLFIISGILTLLSFSSRYILIAVSEEKNNLLFTYYGYFAIFPSIFIFLLAKKLNPFLNNHINFAKVISGFSRLSFGVYLLHGFFIHYLPFEKGSFMYRIPSIFIVYLICCGITFCLQKIKFLKWMVP